MGGGHVAHLSLPELPTHAPGGEKGGEQRAGANMQEANHSQGERKEKRLKNERGTAAREKMSRRQEGDTTTVPLMCKQVAGNRGREWVCSARFCEQSDEALFKGWESGQADGRLLTVRREPEGRKHRFTFKETLRDLNQPCP